MEIKKLWHCFTEIMTGFALALILIQLGWLNQPQEQISELVEGGNEVVISPPQPSAKK